MSDFMQKQVEFGEWYEVDGACGIEVVPADLVVHPPMTLGQWYEPEDENNDDTEIMGFLGTLADYIETDVELVCQVRRIEGWGARLSAPGYMDCTEWTVFVTEKEARQHLDDVFGEDEE